MSTPADPITRKLRLEIAAATGLNEQYLYQCLTGRRAMDAAEAVRIDRLNKGVRRWHLRPNDWHLIWPELIGAEGAPAVPQETERAAA